MSTSLGESFKPGSGERRLDERGIFMIMLSISGVTKQLYLHSIDLSDIYLFFLKVQ